mmetsp:Transcript_31611/g.57422  ORF Transcript_31611/g.57422 Transcript_31611/m.57422 type:complete len:205 (-) Transcript_31611:467-1081(-)
MPNSLTSFKFVLTATMCLATAFSPSLLTNQERTVRAFNMVSAVVKVLDTTTTNVSSGSKSTREVATSIGSTFAKKRSSRPFAFSMQLLSVERAVCTKRGPRKLPPMPMATTLRSFLPVTPFHSPLRIFSLNDWILSKTCQTSGTTSTPSATIFWSRRARVATWRTERSSVLLIWTPLNMASILPRKLAASARSRRSLIVLGVTR